MPESSNAADSAPSGEDSGLAAQTTPNSAGRREKCSCRIITLSHYAAFPTAIPKRAILAGTSARGQCPECGAPWVRSTTHRYESIPGGSAYGKGNNRVKAGDLDSMGAGRRFENRAARVVDTLGWQPGCTHGLDPIPQTVLDPFAGTGTTCLVADRLGRDAVGIELSPTYAEMARRRLTDDAGPMFADVVS